MTYFRLFVHRLIPSCMVNKDVDLRLTYTYLLSHAAMFVLNGYPDIIRFRLSMQIANYPLCASLYSRQAVMQCNNVLVETLNPAQSNPISADVNAASVGLRIT